MASDEPAATTLLECFKCGADIEPHLSAYGSWDEQITLARKPASDSEYVETTESGGKHPQTVTRRFCSRDCLEAFVQMGYPLDPGDSDHGGADP